MTDKELEQALRRALKPREPGVDFSAQVMARVDADRPREPRDTRLGRGGYFRRWSTPAALAACALVAVGLVHWRSETADRERGVEARAQLLQALTIAGMQVNSARAAVLREEGQLE
ncbi:MAG TPA: hypothetical protein VHY19_15960 [Steroidobacteraceae bacterium]|jgi:hypothetical protein|nr:hypothetical protein [Steroidobacteraceae bacterium]